MSYHLLIHNILFLFGALVNIGIAFFVFFSNRSKRNVTAVTFAFSSVAVAVFQVSHLLGTNAADAETSRNILMFNLTDIWIGIFMTHWFLGLIGQNVKQRIGLAIVYISGIAIFITCILFPRLFLVDSVQKLYLPFYYEPGPMYYIFFFWFMAVSVYHFSQLIIAYFREKDAFQKNRFKYILLAMLYAYAFGTTAFLLVFDIPLDPALSSFFGLYPIIIVYAILQYEVFDIRVLAKKTFVYALAILFVAFVFFGVNLIGNFFSAAAPDLPSWLTSATISVLIGSVGIYVWRQAREADIAKYEFITVITHKFRTPLTRIKWSIEELMSSLPEDKKEAANIILESERQLHEMTDLLVRLSETDASRLVYKLVPLDFSGLLKEIRGEYELRMTAKNINFNVEAQDGISIMGDKEKVRSLIQILLDNAISYTPNGGKITVKLVRYDYKFAALEVTDSGIGMSKETLSQVFNRFYRGEKARHADTEGMGIGLFMAKNITSKLGGKIVAKSAGEGKGSTFIIWLPLEK